MTEQTYYGKDCPVDMVQVEFVGVDPHLRYSDYGWKPCRSAFLEVYVDGKRFRINIGTWEAADGTWRRGLNINCSIDVLVDKHSVNAIDIYFGENI